MLMRASIKPSSMLMNNQIIEINRGEIVFSQNNFANRNNMSRQQLRTFLKKLEKTKMIEVKTANIVVKTEYEKVRMEDFKTHFAKHIFEKYVS